MTSVFWSGYLCSPKRPMLGGKRGEGRREGNIGDKIFYSVLTMYIYENPSGVYKLRNRNREVKLTHLKSHS